MEAYRELTVKMKDEIKRKHAGHVRVHEGFREGGVRPFGYLCSVEGIESGTNVDLYAMFDRNLHRHTRYATGEVDKDILAEFEMVSAFGIVTTSGRNPLEALTENVVGQAMYG
jgi:hypothetical protein